MVTMTSTSYSPDMVIVLIATVAQRARLDAGPQQKHSRVLFENTGYLDISKYNNNHIAVYSAEKRL